MLYALLMLIACASLFLAAGLIVMRAMQQSSAVLEYAAGILLVSGLILLGYRLHQITSM